MAAVELFTGGELGIAAPPGLESQGLLSGVQPMRWCSLLPLALLLVAAPAVGDDIAADDARLLRDAGIGTDPAALLDFFRKRTPTDADRRRIADLVRQLGSEAYAEREAASRELVLRGEPAREALRGAAGDPDPEVRRRAARCLEEIATGPGPELPMAAARALSRRPVPDAAAVFLAFLPHAGDEGVEAAVRDALLALHPESGRLDPAVTAALADPRPAVRGAAAHVAGRRGNETQRADVRRLLDDPDLTVRFRAARALLAAGDRAAVPALIDLLVQAPQTLLWQVEEALFQLAGDKAPSIAAADLPSEARRRARDAWAAWWEREGPSLDPARAAQSDAPLGLTLGVEYNTGRVWEAGPDGTVRWELTGLSGPMDAQVLPGGRVLVAEANARRVSERDRLGRIVWEQKVEGEPTGCQRLPNGHTFVSTYSTVTEFRRDGTQVYSFALGSGSNAIRKARNGHVVYATQDAVIEIDTAGNRVRTVPLPRESMWVGLADLPGDRFLVANSATGRVIEVAPDGKLLWEGKVPGACGVARLPNGHTLVATAQRVVELDRDAKAVWEKRSTGYVRRVYRR
jgi:HEAT repeat protein